MNNVNKTLYIPLYGKALVSKKGIILCDKKAEEMWEEEKFPLKGKSKSKWLAYYMGIRAAVFDQWLKEKQKEFPSHVVLHLGCGLDSRIERVKATSTWYDVDFESVITERKRYFSQTDLYHILSADIRDGSFIETLAQAEYAIVILEGVSMYLTNDELRKMLKKLKERFPHIRVLVDCYTPFAAKISKFKNPIKDVGMSEVFGIKSPEVLQEGTGIMFVKEHEITPTYLIEQLHGFEKFIFKTLYAGKISKSLYKLYEYES